MKPTKHFVPIIIMVLLIVGRFASENQAGASPFDDPTYYGHEPPRYTSFHNPSSRSYSPARNNPFRNTYSRYNSPFSEEEEEKKKRDEEEKKKRDEEEKKKMEEVIVTARRPVRMRPVVIDYGRGLSYADTLGLPEYPQIGDGGLGGCSPGEGEREEGSDEDDTGDGSSKDAEGNKGTNPTGKGIRSDGQGGGNYGDARGDRTHKGVDFLATVGQDVVAPFGGRVAAVGTISKNGKVYRSIRIETSNGLRIKILYVSVLKSLKAKYDAALAAQTAGETEVFPSVKKGEVVGVAQDVTAAYNSGMKNHVHVEISKWDTEKQAYITEDPAQHVDTTPTPAQSAQPTQRQLSCSLQS